MKYQRRNKHRNLFYVEHLDNIPTSFVEARDIPPLTRYRCGFLNGYAPADGVNLFMVCYDIRPYRRRLQ